MPTDFLKYCPHRVGKKKNNKKILPLTEKDKLLNYIKSLPDDLQWSRTNEGQYNDINIKVFTKPKSK